MNTSDNSNGPQTSSGRSRLSSVFFGYSGKPVRKQAEVFLFIVGLIVEYILLCLVLSPFASKAPTIYGAIPQWIALGILGCALYVHQFLVFRNYSLHFSISEGRVKPLELLICLLFGVLTGEAGYLLILGLCAWPELMTDLAPRLVTSFVGIAVLVIFCVSIACLKTMKKSSTEDASLQNTGEDEAKSRKRDQIVYVVAFLIVAALTSATYFYPITIFAINFDENRISWFFAKKPLNFDDLSSTAHGDLAWKVISWLMHALGVMLKAVFAVGAIALSAMVLAWDLLARKGFCNSRSPDIAATGAPGNTETMGYFLVMDITACIIWTAILGMILPSGIGPIPPSACWTWVILLSLFYGATAGFRLKSAAEKLGKLSDDDEIEKTII